MLYAQRSQFASGGVAAPTGWRGWGGRWRRWCLARAARRTQARACWPAALSAALAGGAIGAATHHAGEGALIGAAAGATLGGVTGAAVDNHQQKVAVRRKRSARALGLQDVVTLTQSGTSDDIIINQIRTSGTVYHLRGDEIVWLKQNGVHDPVIEAMQATASLRRRRWCI